MRRWRRLAARVGCFVRRSRAERELEREMAAHLALLEDHFARRGMAPAEARRAALRAMGGIEQAKEMHRDERSFAALDQTLQDIRHAWRSFGRSKGFVAVALLSLAFGIGVNTAIFTLVNGILLKKLPVADPDRIVQIKARTDYFDNSAMSFPVFRELRRRTEIFQDVIGFGYGGRTLEIDGVTHAIDSELVTGAFFSFFSARPALGRLLDEEDDRVEGAHKVCVLSYQAWQRYFGGDPRVLHRTVRISSVPLEVVGVAGPDFAGAELQRRVDAWAPTALCADFLLGTREIPNMIWIRTLARLKPGIAFGEADARLKAAGRAIEDALPKDRANEGQVYRLLEASKGFDRWRTSLHDPLFILMGAVTLVLLVACANLANLVLARTSERHQEFAIKLSLGISRRRLIRQLLVETLMLAAAGGAAAVLLAREFTALLLDLFNTGNGPGGLDVSPDLRVLLYTLGASMATVLLAGLYPAWQASRTDTAPALKGAAFHGLRRAFVRRGLILVQVTLAVVLLLGASLFTRSLRKLKTINLGYDIDRILTVSLSQRGPAYKKKPVTAPPALAAVLARVRQLPGVESAALTETPVLSGGMRGISISVKDAGGTSREIGDLYFLAVSPGYFATLRTPLLRGRDFSAADRPGAPPVAIVNQRLAARIWPGQDPIGKHFGTSIARNIEVVGLVGDSKYQNVREESRPILYLPFDQRGVVGCAMEIRARGGPASVERDVRRIVRSDAPAYEISDAASMELMRDRLIAQDRLLAFLAELFGALGILLALVGIYGLISYSVTRRTREVGIRMSVGASAPDVLWLFVRESVLLIAAGGLMGLPLALWLARFAGKLLYDVSPADPWGIAATVVLLAADGLFASCVPGRRATRINPVEALRYE